MALVEGRISHENFGRALDELPTYKPSYVRSGYFKKSFSKDGEEKYSKNTNSRGSVAKHGSSPLRSKIYKDFFSGDTSDESDCSDESSHKLSRKQSLSTIYERKTKARRLPPPEPGHTKPESPHPKRDVSPPPTRRRTISPDLDSLSTKTHYDMDNVSVKGDVSPKISPKQRPANNMSTPLSIQASVAENRKNKSSRTSPKSVQVAKEKKVQIPNPTVSESDILRKKKKHSHVKVVLDSHSTPDGKVSKTSHNHIKPDIQHSPSAKKKKGVKKKELLSSDVLRDTSTSKKRVIRTDIDRLCRITKSEKKSKSTKPYKKSQIAPLAPGERPLESKAIKSKKLKSKRIKTDDHHIEIPIKPKNKKKKVSKVHDTQVDATEKRASHSRSSHYKIIDSQVTSQSDKALSAPKKARSKVHKHEEIQKSTTVCKRRIRDGSLQLPLPPQKDINTMEAALLERQSEYMGRSAASKRRSKKSDVRSVTGAFNSQSKTQEPVTLQDIKSKIEEVAPGTPVRRKISSKSRDHVPSTPVGARSSVGASGKGARISLQQTKRLVQYVQAQPLEEETHSLTSYDEYPVNEDTKGLLSGGKKPTSGYKKTLKSVGDIISKCARFLPIAGVMRRL